jgi:hypothetical protein
MTRDISAYRTHIERALAYGDDTHTYADVQEMVAAGRAVFWPGPASCVVTETILGPRRKSLHFFLAAGKLSELEIMAPHLLEWGRSEGCTRATLIGRPGWQRSFLTRTGWSVSPLILMGKDL